MELQVEHLFVFFSITHFARKNKRGRKNFGSENCMKKERGIRVVEYGSPTKSSKQGIKTCRGEETVGKAEGSKAGFQLQNTEAPKMFRKGLPGEGERKKENGNRRKRYGD